MERLFEETDSIFSLFECLLDVHDVDLDELGKRDCEGCLLYRVVALEELEKLL